MPNPCRTAYLTVHVLSWLAVLCSLPLLLAQTGILSSLLPSETSILVTGGLFFLCGFGGVFWSGQRLRKSHKYTCVTHPYEETSAAEIRA